MYKAKNVMKKEFYLKKERRGRKAVKSRKKAGKESGEKSKKKGNSVESEKKIQKCDFTSVVIPSLVLSVRVRAHLQAHFECFE